MTPKQAAKWIRATFPVFRAHPEQWGKMENYDRDTRKRCVIGGAACLLSQGRPFRVDHVFLYSGRLTRPIVTALGDDLWDAVTDANDGARNVEDMISRVEAVLREAGL